MDELTPQTRSHDEALAYRPPTVTFLGDVADLTRQKEVGAFDGTEVLGVQLGS